jgi:hypothetical protein
MYVIIHGDLDVIIHGQLDVIIHGDLDVIIHGLVMVLPLYIYGTIEIDIIK